MSDIMNTSGEIPTLTRKRSDVTRGSDQADNLYAQQEVTSDITAIRSLMEKTMVTPQESAQNLTDAMRPMNEKNQEMFKSMSQGIMKVGSTAGENLGKMGMGMLLGPFQLLTSQLEELGGFNIWESVKSGFGKIGGLFKRDKDTKTEGILGDRKFKGTPKRNKIVPIDPGSVLVADTIRKSMGGEEEGLLDLDMEGGLGGLFQRFLGGRGGLLQSLSGGIGGIFKNPAMLMKLGGGALFAGLTLHDFFKHGLGKMREGNIVGGIMDTLLGGEAETDADVWKNMGKQTAKWAGFGMMVGGPVGAAVGAGLGALVSGIKGAYEMEWDKQVGDVGDNLRELWRDPNVGIGKKILGTLGGAGKGILGSFAGGVRDAIDAGRDSIERQKAIWADPERSTISKIGGSIVEGVGMLLEVPRRFIGGTIKKAGEFVWGLLPQKWRDGISNVAGKVDDFFGNAFSETSANIKGIWNDEEKNFFQKIGGTLVEGVRGAGRAIRGVVGNEKVKEWFGRARDFVDGAITTKAGKFGLEQAYKKAKQWLRGTVDKAKQFFRGIGDRVSGYFEDVKERGFVEVTREKIQEVAQKVGNFFRNLGGKIKGFFVPSEDEITGETTESKLSEIASRVGGFFRGIGSKIRGFFVPAEDEATGETTPSKLQELAGRVGGFFRNIGGKIRGFFLPSEDEITGETTPSKLQEIADRVRGFFQGIGAGVQTFIDDVNREGLGATLRNHAENAIEAIGGFFGNLGSKIKGYFQDIGIGTFSAGYIAKEQANILKWRIQGLDEEERMQRRAAMRAAEFLKMQTEGKFGEEAESDLESQLRSTAQYRQILSEQRGRNREEKAMNELVDQLRTYIESGEGSRGIAQVAQMNFMQRFSADQVLLHGTVAPE